ncbi:MAG TPA: glycosyltransferase family 2 protein [Dehalococcoidia bacterium]
MTETAQTSGTSAETLASVVIPAYNEGEAIGETIERVRRAFAPSVQIELLVVDDGSTDATPERARAAGATVISHPVNLGQGAAIKTGLAHARGAYVALIDGDGSYPAEEMPKLVQLAVDASYEQVIGDRQREAGSMRPLRAVVKRTLRWFAAFLSGQAVGDLNSGMRVIRRDAALRYAPLIPDGFSNSTTLTLATLSHRGRIAFVPITYSRREGNSKFRPIGDTYNMALAIVRMVVYVDPLRVLLPPAVLFILLGLAKAVADAVRYDWHITASAVLLVMTGVQIAVLALIADLIVRRTR